MAKNRHIKDRRGVLLLIILALLALFGVTAVGFYIVATSGKRGADASLRAAKDTERPEDQLNEAIAQVLHGSNRSMSVLRTHSLLEDLYGNITPGILTTPPTTPASGYIGIEMPQAHLRVGCWLTMVSGSAVQQSRLIEQYQVNASGVTTAILQEFTSATPAAGDRYIVQNAPWRGTVRHNPSATPDPYQIRPICPPSSETPPRSGQIMEFTALSPPPTASHPPRMIPLSELHRFAGATLTMLSGPAQGRTTRIVGFVPAGGTYNGGQLRIAGFDDVLTKDVVAYVQSGGTCDYIINSLPFSGTGFGLTLDPTINTERLRQVDPGEDINGNGTLDSGEDRNGNGILDTYPQMEYALAPNPTQFLPSIPSGYVDPAGPGGANEDYDAVDYQNMLLSTGVDLPIDVDGDGIADRNLIIPSLHRPDLINYWFRWAAGQPDVFGASWPVSWTPEQRWQALLQPWTVTNANLRARISILRRKIMLRPLHEDHPAFDGGNAASVQLPTPILPETLLQALSNRHWERLGPWDVDNNGDGITDSVWVDLGLPARSTKDGRQYKPLFAILCVDLDGRLNLNAHGSTVQQTTGYGTSNGPYAGGTTSLTLPAGQGYGPAEVRLSSVLSTADTISLLRGNTSSGFEGRYGESVGSTAEAGVTTQFNQMSLIKLFGLPQDYTDIYDGTGNIDNTKLRWFGSPPDVWGRGTVGLDFRGQPFYSALAWTNENRNHPYDLDLTRRLAVQDATHSTQADNPFTVAELERLLRMYDVDARMLPNRLVALTTGGTLVTNRNLFTTDSWDIPSPSNTLTISDASGNPLVDAASKELLPSGHGRKVTDLLRARLIVGNGWTEPLGPTNEQTITEQMAQLLSWDVLANLRMDINRPLGNGRDDNGNGVVDEPAEASTEAGWMNLFTTGATVPFRLSNGLNVNGDKTGGGADIIDAVDEELARQLYARHLFVLALLLTDAGYIQPTTPGTFDDSLSPGPTGQKRSLTVRRIAQWAINVVDFRDPDSIMTPFEYDENPFDGWGVDGILTTDEVASGACPDRRVVWGCESPDLVLTETLAFHDRRVADTVHDAGSQERRYKWNGTTWIVADPDLDQPRIPQGSAFFELYCTRNPNNPVAPRELYTYNTTTKQWYLDLGRLAPASGGQQYPVWRMVISEPNTVSGQDVRQRLADRPDSSSLEPRQSHNTPHPGTDDNFSLLHGTTDPNVNVERVVWFTHQSPSGYDDDDRIFYRRQGSQYLAPGRYLVVGPRQTTVIGSLTNPLGTPSQRQIHLTTGGVAVTDSSGTSQYLEVLDISNPQNTAKIQPAQTMIVASDPPSTWTNVSQTAPMGIGINISEPLFSSGYYDEPDEVNPATTVTDAYGDLNQTNSAKPFPDHPEDSKPGTPLEASNMLATGTYEHVRTVFLQRLANPLLPYNAVTNPYRTVDWAPIDLTVFTGEDRRPASLPSTITDWDPDDPRSESNKKVYFATRQRNGGNHNLWAQSWTTVPAVASWVSAYTAASPGNDVFLPDFAFDPGTPADRYHTLGFLNKDFGDPWRWDQIPAASGSDTAAYKKTYTGDPQTPFPWLTWNNRPYASPAELLLVPSVSSARLTQEFSIVKTQNPYDAGNAHGFAWPFGHLPNFFHASNTADQSPHLYRLLEYLRVPSPFVGLETTLNPLNTYYGNNGNSDTTLLRPPFNFLSKYREPGRINLNTVFNINEWTAILNGHLGPSYAQIVESRQGHVAGTTYPTLFANPFRSAGSSEFVPQLPAGASLSKRGVNVTFMRARSEDPDDTTAGKGDQPLQFAANTAPYRHTDRNPYFRYGGLEHLTNLVTTRSNVYAVWITVGYFEVEQLAAGYDTSIYPDGYTLGAELGSDTGDVKRHRAFYILDRSIPVGYKRGEDLNTGNCVLLKRFIE